MRMHKINICNQLNSLKSIKIKKAFKSLLVLSDHCPGFQITPRTPKSLPRLSNRSLGSQITPRAFKSPPGVSNHSPGSQINSHRACWKTSEPTIESTTFTC